ncbi:MULTISPECIES: curli production assembly/transport protein CsgE [Pseudoalteromonas]|jgi:curli production assembly/transport component CsgE|uniref:Curli production assembly/transport component CsgE n=2 Tax=Pseudoalteromonas aliena TaxID=247523 RepID=A0A1Q2H264_9GAMM|nr:MULTISPECIES: curli production assembly/transport protein CsgE [Pseudoalteromonas]AQQ01361.1 curli production assembly protein CsgE [Pseudoalteromonas aliena]MBB1384100.1 curli production assembly/transport protein CsgE [Pseudoalteromonas sp. SG45-5]MBB1392212.1 curli production assembly/transport protein CsgE [Pseudoalteromonas sp. SG44-4]MBB1449236.1 curli production assembly/transport protein CsgE [Pseudoalteromonas sp. SG41-6]MBE0359250.1 curli production assembly/transport component Cs
MKKNKNNLCGYIFTLLICFLPSVYAEELEIDGLLLDRSISRFGHQFYYEFSNYWRDLPSTAGFNIEIKETVIPKAGTKLSLIMNNQLVYATYLGRRLEPLDERVEQAVYTVIDAMARSNMTVSTPDMAVNGW